MALLTGMLGFAVAVVIITVPDLVRGKSITGNGGRTTFFGGRSASKHPTTPTSSPASPNSTTPSPRPRRLARPPRAHDGHHAQHDEHVGDEHRTSRGGGMLDHRQADQHARAMRLAVDRPKTDRRAGATSSPLEDGRSAQISQELASAAPISRRHASTSTRGGETTRARRSRSA